MFTSLVTGGAGFIGSHIVDKLIKMGHKVIVLDNLSTGKLENVNRKALFYSCDITNSEQLNQAVRDFDFNGYVFHCAAKARIQPSFKKPREYFNTNILGLFNVLELSRRYKIKKFVFLSSSSVYGEFSCKTEIPLEEHFKTNPASPYSFQKLIGEQMIKHYYKIYGLPVITCRLFNVYGKRQLIIGAYAAVIGIFLEQKKQDKALTIVKPGTQKRDFTHISDIVDGLISAAKSNIKNGEIFNLGTGENCSIKEIADLISSKQVYLDERPGEYPYTLADIYLARKLLNYNPKIYNIKKGLKLC